MKTQTYPRDFSKCLVPSHLTIIDVGGHDCTFVFVLHVPIRPTAGSGGRAGGGGKGAAPPHHDQDGSESVDQVETTTHDPVQPCKQLGKKLPSYTRYSWEGRGTQTKGSRTSFGGFK